jgi:hypothetical protein
MCRRTSVVSSATCPDGRERGRVTDDGTRPPRRRREPLPEGSSAAGACCPRTLQGTMWSWRTRFSRSQCLRSTAWSGAWRESGSRRTTSALMRTSTLTSRCWARSCRSTMWTRSSTLGSSPTSLRWSRSSTGLRASRCSPTNVVYLAPDPAAVFVALTEASAAAFPGYPPYGGEVRLRHAAPDRGPDLVSGDGAVAGRGSCSHRSRGCRGDRGATDPQRRTRASRAFGVTRSEPELLRRPASPKRLVDARLCCPTPRAVAPKLGVPADGRRYRREAARPDAEHPFRPSR